MKYWLLIFLCVFATSSFAQDERPKKKRKEKVENKPKKELVKKKRKTGPRGDCGFRTNDGDPVNNRNELALKLGPPGMQFGHSNPLSVPPIPQDIEVTYVHHCGVEGNFGLVPGLTGGLRFRKGHFFYGSIGGGLMISAQAIGPGLYSALGVSLSRYWPVSFDMEFKQAVAIGAATQGSGTRLTFPYAFRVGAAYNW